MTMTIRQRVEATLYGDCLDREGNFEAVAADVLGMTQEEVDKALIEEMVGHPIESGRIITGNKK
jgi:hypothetical protein